MIIINQLSGSGDSYFHSGPSHVDQMATGKVLQKNYFANTCKKLFRIIYK